MDLTEQQWLALKRGAEVQFGRAVLIRLPSEYPQEFRFNMKYAWGEALSQVCIDAVQRKLKEDEAAESGYPTPN